MNHAWARGFWADPNSAVPVLPKTPPGKPTPAAVPVVTTARIIGRSVLKTLGLSFCDLADCAGAGLSTSCGGRQVPSSTAPAIDAWLSGLTRSVPWPKASAARSISVRGLVNRPSVAGMPRLGRALKPNVAADDASLSPFSRCVARVMKVELHDTANAVCRLVEPRCSLLKLWNVRPPMFTRAGHWTVLAGCSPVPVRAEAVTTLNVEPGGNTPWSARLNPLGRSMTASTRPVDGWIATKSIGLFVEAAR